MPYEMVKAYDDIGIQRTATTAELLEHPVRCIARAVAALSQTYDSNFIDQGVKPLQLRAQ
jgi:hypothetical protein